MLYLLFVIMTLTASVSLFAGEVVKKNRKKSYVVVDISQKDGAKKKQRVCFFAQDQRLGCGRVQRVGKRRSIVRVKRSLFKKLSKGDLAELQGGSKTSASYGMAVVFIPGQGPAQYNDLSYFYYDPNQPESLWENLGTRSSDLLRLGIEANIPIGQTHTLKTGLRYGTFTNSSFKPVTRSSADYLPENLERPNLFVETRTAATQFGVWLDWMFYKLNLGSSLGLGFGAGLDFDSSTVELRATRKDDGTNPDQPIVDDWIIADARSTLTVVSLRLTPDLSFKLGSFGEIFLNPLLILPLTASNAFTTEFFTEDPDAEIDNVVLNNNLGAIPDPKKDLEDALGHSKSSIAFHVVVGTRIQF